MKLPNSVYSHVLDDEKLVSWFLDHGADPNARNMRDCTPLSWAVHHGPFSVIKLLFSKGGSIEHGQLLHWAVQRKLPDRLIIIRFLFEKGVKDSINKVMLQDDLEAYCINMYGGISTPLSHAAAAGNLDVVKFLVENGADPLVKDPSLRIPLDWALSENHTEVAEFLRPLSILPSVPRVDFVDKPGYHFGKGPARNNDDQKQGKETASSVP